MILLPVLRFAYSFTVSVKSNRDPKAAVRFWWQGQKESNPQPTVLETVALPIELCPCHGHSFEQPVLVVTQGSEQRRRRQPCGRLHE